MGQRVQVKREKHEHVESSRQVSEPVQTQETDMTSQAQSEDSEDEMSEDEDQILLDNLDEEDMRERWEVAQTHKNKYAGVGHPPLESFKLTFRKSEMQESSNQ
jgi:nicotinate-nucleotide pyrophosphorylase